MGQRRSRLHTRKRNGTTHLLKNRRLGMHQSEHRIDQELELALSDQEAPQVLSEAGNETNRCLDFDDIDLRCIVLLFGRRRNGRSLCGWRGTDGWLAAVLGNRGRVDEWLSGDPHR